MANLTLPVALLCGAIFLHLLSIFNTRWSFFYIAPYHNRIIRYSLGSYFSLPGDDAAFYILSSPERMFETGTPQTGAPQTDDNWKDDDDNSNTKGLKLTSRNYDDCSAAEEATCDTLQTTGNVVGTLIFLSAVLCLLAVNSIRLSTLATPPPSPAPKPSPAPPIVATPIRDSYAPPDQDDFPLAEPFLPILSYADATDATNSAAFWPLSLRHLSRARKFLVLSLFSSLTSLAYYSATTPLHDLCGSIAGATDTRSDVGCGYGGSYVANTCAAILAALALFPVTAAIFRLQVLTEHDQHLAPMTNGLARNTSGMCCLITIAFLTIWLAFPGEPGGIFTALDYCDSDDSWAYLSTRPPTCPSGAGYYQSPTYDSTGDSADSTVCYETCCEPGVNPTVDYNQYLKDGSKECDAGLKSLSNAACSPFARAFVDDFNVDQMQQQPVHMCEAFCSVLWGDCLNSTIAGGENEGRLVGDVYAAFDSEFCEKELKLAEVRDGFFVDDCFSGVGGAYAGGAAIMISVWSIAALI